MLTADEISHRYARGGSPALREVSLALQPGVTGLVGVNGAGKSTLLAALCGGLRPSEGRIRVNGLDLYGPERRVALGHVALMPQEFTVPVNARARDTVAYLAWLRGLTGSAIWAAADRALEMVELSAQAGKRFRSLSGGMRRRLALAQALAGDPQVLLLDEPTTGLDPEQRAILRALIQGLPGDRVTLMSSHVMEDLDSTCSRIVVIDEGAVLFDGGAEQFRRCHGGPERSSEFAFLSMVASQRAVQS